MSLDPASLGSSWISLFINRNQHHRRYRPPYGIYNQTIGASCFILFCILWLCCAVLLRSMNEWMNSSVRYHQGRTINVIRGAPGRGYISYVHFVHFKSVQIVSLFSTFDISNIFHLQGSPRYGHLSVRFLFHMFITDLVILSIILENVCSIASQILNTLNSSTGF